MSSLGYRNFVKIGKYYDATAVLIMDPVILKASDQMLKEVVIKGSPSITYKTDTVEYQASDYVVREGATVGDLLNKMEGMIVEYDGSLTYNGTRVDKARINGKDFISGDVSTVTKNLPADIVEKAQIVDDYGDEAARTGIKDGAPSKVLNLTTKASRSLGYFGTVGGGVGNDARYEGNLLGTRLNANRNYTLAANMSNTVNGVAANSFLGQIAGSINQPDAGISAGSGGTTKKQSAGLTYRDQWSRKVRVNMNYSFNLTDINSINSSISKDFSTNGTMFSEDESVGANNSKIHNFSFEYENELDSANFLRIIPILSYNSSLNNDQSSTLLTGLLHQSQKNTILNSSQTPNYGLTTFYQHYFPKKRRNYSIQLTGSSINNEQSLGQNSNIIYFNQATNSILRDSLIQRLVERNNLTSNYKGSVTYSEPLNLFSTLQFHSQVTHNGYDNKTITNDLGQVGFSTIIDSLSNNFKYSVTEARLSVGYSYLKGKYQLTLGAAGVPIVLSGTNNDTGTSVRRKSFNIIPIAGFSYRPSLQQTLSVYYSSAVTAPDFNQIQPVRDVTNPQNTTIGNPNLKPAFSHSVNSYYYLYAPKSRVGVDISFTTIFYEGRIITNIIQTADAYNSLKYEKHYLNINGTNRTGLNYTFSKQAANFTHGVTFTGSIDHLHNIGLSNNLKNVSSQWTFIESLRLRISPVEKFELGPAISYSYYQSDNSIAKAINSKTNILSFTVNGKVVFMKSWVIRYSTNKNFVHGINSNLTNNPFVVNMSLEKEFLKNKAVKLRIQSFDLFNENKLLNRNITETSITDIRSNSLSRYFMMGLSVNLQRWKGTPIRNGLQMQRRGDGSFIY
ncbi:MAG TPA: hypothetical protein DIT07_09190 [Sphingobacteriaceae bacterium]|nr:hypothetical protein [Sphingobacteriaceae bacterium]